MRLLQPSIRSLENTIKLPEGNNVVPLRSDTIRLVQNGCSFHGLRSEDPNQHLKDFLKLVDSLDLDGENRERTRLRLFQFSLRDQASNWLERLPAGSISTWEDLTTRFLAQFFPPGRTAKLRNDILMFQQHHGESLSEAWTRFKDLLQKVPHHGINRWLQIQIFYDHVSFHLKCEIDRAAGGKLRNKNADESWEIIENLALYDHEGPSPQPQALNTTFEARVRDYMAAHTERMGRFENAILKQREEINGRMTEMSCYLRNSQTIEQNPIEGDEREGNGTKSTSDCTKEPTKTKTEMPVVETKEVHAKILFGNENVWVEMHRNIAWDKVENPNPQSTPQVPPSFEKNTPPVTCPEEVEKTLGTPIEVEPLNEIKLEEVGLSCDHNTPLSSREVPSFNGTKPQPLLNSPSLDVSLGDVIGLKPPIKPHSPDSSRIKVIFDEKKLESS
ncbi:zinc finger, CCHC-type containing protein [Tanacetum coccineum]